MSGPSPAGVPVLYLYSRPQRHRRDCSSPLAASASARIGRFWPFGLDFPVCVRCLGRPQQDIYLDFAASADVQVSTRALAPLHVPARDEINHLEALAYIPATVRGYFLGWLGILGRSSAIFVPEQAVRLGIAVADERGRKQDTASDLANTF